MATTTLYWLCYEGETKIGPFTSREELLSQLKMITCNGFDKALKTGGWSIRKTRSTK